MMLPGTEGIKLSQDILETADVPVIFLFVGGQEDQVTMVFDMGGGRLHRQAFRSDGVCS